MTSFTYHSPGPSAGQKLGSKPGYYLMTIGSVAHGRFLQTNNERAFVLSQLQDLLNARSVLEAPDPHRRLAAHIDLLAFSVHSQDIRLIAFAIDETSLHYLCRTLVARLLQYQTEFKVSDTPVIEPTTVLVRLAGPHHALGLATSLHLRHADWEYDRYSSIGFYLHDRRGGWMRLWRLTELFQNDPGVYRELLQAYANRGKSAAPTQPGLPNLPERPALTPPSCATGLNEQPGS